MATLGETGGGGTAWNLGGGETTAFLIGQMTEDGTLSAVTADIGTASSGTVHMAVYIGTSTAPGALVTSAGNTAAPGTHANTTISGLSGSLTNGDYVWVAFNRSGTNASVYYTATTGAWKVQDFAQTAGTWDDPWVTISDTRTWQYVGAYITYTPSGGGGSAIAVISNHYRRIKR